ncbi:unnamed protein product, partial [Gongylonema pulchrum]|uniref:BED-type domain-containing protein n=1 Tax=Gongylonema pulchrum TaxID=637853 RepID=A0A183EHL8_9BILA
PNDEAAYSYSYCLSRNLNETIVTVPVDNDYVRQYALVRVAGDGKKRYYRCNQCLKHRRTDKSAPQAYLTMENGRIVGSKHLRHHPNCQPTRRIEATTTSLDRENRKEIRYGLKTPKAAYAEGFYRAIDLASTGKVQGSSILPKIYPSWSRVRKSYFRQNRLGRKDRAREALMEGGGSSSSVREQTYSNEQQQLAGPTLYTYAGDGEDGYVLLEAEEIPEGYEPIPPEELDGVRIQYVDDTSWPAAPAPEEEQQQHSRAVFQASDVKEEQAMEKQLHGSVKRKRQNEDSPRDVEALDEQRRLSETERFLFIGDSRNLSEKPTKVTDKDAVSTTQDSLDQDISGSDSGLFGSKEERRRISRSLVDEIYSNMKRMKQGEESGAAITSELDEQCNKWCYLPCNQKGEICVYASDKVHWIENLNGEMEIAFDPDVSMDEIVKNLKPHGILSTDFVL